MNHPLYPKALVFLQFTTMGMMILFSKNFFSSIFFILIFSLGVFLGVWAIKHNEIGNFNIQPKLKDGSKLITSGIYSYIRHPMYSSVIVMMLAFLLSTPSLEEGLLFVLLLVVLFFKAKREEYLWIQEHPAYKEYQKKTKFFIPYLL